jgi:hypothetical protein
MILRSREIWFFRWPNNTFFDRIRSSAERSAEHGNFARDNVSAPAVTLSCKAQQEHLAGRKSEKHTHLAMPRGCYWPSEQLGLTF